MKAAAFVLLALLAGSVVANEMGNADLLYQRGEKFWYGQGVAVDMAKADALFRQAAAAGSQEARAALELTPRRQAQMGLIDYYLNRYDGADVKLSCAKVDIPAVSDADTYKEVGSKIDAWEACYNRFVANFNRRLPPDKGRPAELTYLMTDAEIKQAAERMDRAYASAGTEGEQAAKAFEAAKLAWQERTNDKMVTTNVLGERITKMRQDALDHRQFMAVNGPVPTLAVNTSKPSAPSTSTPSGPGTGPVKH